MCICPTCPIQRRLAAWPAMTMHRGDWANAQQVRLWEVLVRQEQQAPRDRRALQGRLAPRAKQVRRGPLGGLAFQGKQAKQEPKVPRVPQAFKARLGRRVTLVCLAPQAPLALQAHRVVKSS